MTTTAPSWTGSQGLGIASVAPAIIAAVAAFRGENDPKLWVAVLTYFCLTMLLGDAFMKQLRHNIDQDLPSRWKTALPSFISSAGFLLVLATAASQNPLATLFATPLSGFQTTGKVLAGAIYCAFILGPLGQLCIFLEMLEGPAARRAHSEA